MSALGKYLSFATALAGSVTLDQWTKEWARGTLRPLHRMVVVDGFFDFQYSENPGIAFSLFRDLASGRYVLLAVGVVELIILFVILRRTPASRSFVAGALGLIAGGAIGNMMDRARLGVVTDFILWKVHSIHWPIFNIADAALVVGVLAFLFSVRGPSSSDDSTGLENAPQA